MTTNGTRPRRLRAKLCLVIGTAVMTWAALEIAARIWLAALGPVAAPIQVSADDDGENARLAREIYASDSHTFFALKPNLLLEETANRRIFDVRTNALGLRGEELESKSSPNSWRAICVGDSCTFGSGAKTSETWPAQLEQVIRELRPDLAPEVLNAGVPGFSSYQGREFLRDKGFDLKPDAVLIALGFNDTSKAQPGPGRQFEAGLALTDNEYAAALKSSSPIGCVRLAQRLKLRRVAVQPEQADNYRPRVLIDNYAQHLRDMASEARARQILPVFVVWPVVGQAGGQHIEDRQKEIVRYQSRMRQVSRELDVPLVDLVPAVDGRTDLFIDAVHLNPEGYAYVAQVVGRVLFAHLPPS